MHCCLFTQTCPLLSSGCAKLILYEALTLSWTTNVRWSCGERTHPAQLTIHCTVWSQNTISQISPAMKKRRGVGRRPNKICMHKIQHICSHGNHSACHSLVKLHQGRWGALSGSWWAWLPGTDSHPHPAPLSPSDQHPGHLPHCYVALTPVQLILYFTNHTTDDHHGLKRKKWG